MAWVHRVSQCSQAMVHCLGAESVTVQPLESPAAGLGDVPESWIYLRDDGDSYQVWQPPGRAAFQRAQALCVEQGGTLLDVPQVPHLPLIPLMKCALVLCDHTLSL